MQVLIAVYQFLLLLILQYNVIVESIDIYSIEKDLGEFNQTCKEKCEFYNSDSLSSMDCHCGKQCAQLGTCCLDSFYVYAAQPKLKPACRQIENGGHYFMVDQCSSNESAWASLCNDNDNDLQHGDDNIQKIVPVTSLLTATTYKNYYCLRCHETTYQFMYWILKLESDLPKEKTDEDKSKQAREQDDHLFFFYNKELNKWMASYDEEFDYFPVNVSLILPNQIERLAHWCIQNVISDCSDKWSNEETRGKCQSYMGIREVRKSGETAKKYKNTHCALCNFEKSDDIVCKFMEAIPFDGKVPFSFTFLLDINRSDGEFVGKVQKCSEDHLWDPYTKKCRKLSCALPGYTIKSGKCVQD